MNIKHEMKSNKKDFFDKKAKDYDKEQARVDNVTNIANLILKKVAYSKDMSIMDFGSGTGLLLSKIAPHIGKITAIDISKSMNETLESKRNTIDCKLDIIELDLSKDNLYQKFDGIISSMTIHHVKDTLALFNKFYGMLNSGGTIALSDLDKEDGSFHNEDTGIFHFGFDREEFVNLAKRAGFKNVKIQTVGLVEKPYGKYPVFLLTGNK
ncbi:MAG: class I SAM-dependent methyltransferase [Bacteroidales bacterium]|jgi:cyclopropane fatty-acyl-phospholipid synthase-like methyltransferase|nr:class I SAM-dependent methyltransferase [Bacteroidales bacterium]